MFNRLCSRTRRSDLTNAAASLQGLRRPVLECLEVRRFMTTWVSGHGVLEVTGTNEADSIPQPPQRDG